MADSEKLGVAAKLLSFIPDVSWKAGALALLGGVGVSFLIPKGISTSLNDEEKSIVAAISKSKEQRVRHEFSDTVTLQYVPDTLSKSGKCYVRINAGMMESSYGPQRIHSNWDISYQLLYGKDENISATNRIGQGKEIRMKGSSSGNIFVLKPIFTDGSSGVSESQSDFSDVIKVLAKSTDVTLDYGEAPFSQKYSLKGFVSAYKVAKNLCGNEK